MRRVMQLLLCGVFFVVLSGCAHLGRPVEPPTVRLVNIMPAGSSLFEQRLRLTLRVTNPNEFALSWSGCKVNTRFNDMDLLPAVSKENGSVEGLGEAEIKVEATVSTFDVLRQIISLKGGQGKLAYDMDGVLFLSGLRAGQMPFTSKGTLWDSGAVK
ncbi:MAG: LEA type 2 family protein [Desulfovibrionales bacterium]|nr:LEA type 2 family protein [Desulfovibrionales bacterium]